jgi:hypothetical protein
MVAPAGFDLSGLSRIDIRIADLGGTTLGLAAGHTARPSDGQEVRADYNSDHEDGRTTTSQRPCRNR